MIRFFFQTFVKSCIKRPKTWQNLLTKRVDMVSGLASEDAFRRGARRWVSCSFIITMLRWAAPCDTCVYKNTNVPSATVKICDPSSAETHFRLMLLAAMSEQVDVRFNNRLGKKTWQEHMDTSNILPFFFPLTSQELWKEGRIREYHECRRKWALKKFHLTTLFIRYLPQFHLTLIFIWSSYSLTTKQFLSQSISEFQQISRNVCELRQTIWNRKRISFFKCLLKIISLQNLS